MMALQGSLLELVPSIVRRQAETKATSLATSRDVLALARPNVPITLEESLQHDIGIYIYIYI